MLAIKLSRFGTRKKPTYRIIVLEKTKDPWGDYLEMLGHYNPKTKEIELKKDRIEYWLKNGAQPTDTVHNLLVSNGILNEKKKNITTLSKKRNTKINEKTVAKKEADKAKIMDETPALTEEPVVESPVETPAPAEEPVVEVPAEKQEVEEKTE